MSAERFVCPSCKQDGAGFDSGSGDVWCPQCGYFSSPCPKCKNAVEGMHDNCPHCGHDISAKTDALVNAVVP